MDSPGLHALLHKHWGYSAFRPKHESIVQAILAGRDAAVVMPTGGGKSLCYQLPAVVMQRTCVVVSPLIALMQDQAASMHEIGVEAAFINSALTAREIAGIMRRAEKGAVHVLYISPERIVRDDILDWLARVPIGFFAIDEAHCISEWGHEFRPEYRQLGTLRERFPDVPIAAFTASATRLVRHDILAQLHLRDAARFVLSFHRPNLRYLVRECAAGEQESLLDSALDYYDEGNIILYAPTIKMVEDLAARLSHRGIAIVPYHGRMDAQTRRRNQELWMSGEKRVLVGTIAFGLGINKPDVRAVIHLSLPKSLEQFYQEAGRAGRDGESADCVMLWRPQDLALLVHFIKQIQDPDEERRAWQRFRVIRGFVEQPGCRHRRICLHFGETPKWEICQACDECGVTLDWMIAPESAPAPVPRPRRVAGATAARLRPIDATLLNALKEWRAGLARTQRVPAYVILHDATLEALCTLRPRTIQDLLSVPGIGEKRAGRYGPEILKLLEL